MKVLRSSFFHSSPPFIMRLFRQLIGIDVSAKKLAVYFLRQYDDLSTKCAGSKSFDNTESGLVKLFAWLDKRTNSALPVQCVMEATGVYHERAAYGLHDAERPVCIVLPNRIKAYAHSLNNYSKTDDIDAEMIACFAAANKLKNWAPPSPHMRRLRTLTRERQQIINERTEVKCQRAAYQASAHPPARTLRRIEVRINFLDRQVAQIEKELKELCAADEVLSRGLKVLKSMPGVQLVTACVLMAETDCFALFSNRNQLIKYAGLDVVDKQSGTSVKGRSKVSKRGNSHLRAALFMPAKTVSKKTGAMRPLFEKQFAKYDNYNKALMPIQRKLLLLAYALFKTDTLYDPNYKNNNNKMETEQAALMDCLQ
ncbi:MAG: IS110 family transposase [Bacteroidota bacterium]